MRLVNSIYSMVLMHNSLQIRSHESTDIRRYAGKRRIKVTVRECYQYMGADYKDVLRRLKTDERICKFLAMLLRDPSYSALEQALDSRDYETAFRAAHTIKGIAMNLSLTRLTEVSSQLTEALRPRTENDVIWSLFQQFKAAYNEMTTAIHMLLG